MSTPWPKPLTMHWLFAAGIGGLGPANDHVRPSSPASQRYFPSEKSQHAFLPSKARSNGREPAIPISLNDCERALSHVTQVMGYFAAGLSEGPAWFADPHGPRSGLILTESVTSLTGPAGKHSPQARPPADVLSSKASIQQSDCRCRHRLHACAESRFR